MQLCETSLLDIVLEYEKYTNIDFELIFFLSNIYQKNVFEY